MFSFALIWFAGSTKGNLALCSGDEGGKLRIRRSAQIRVLQWAVLHFQVEQERLAGNEPVQADARDRIVENAVPAAHCKLLIAEHVPGETEAWRRIVPVAAEEVVVYAFIALQQQPARRRGPVARLATRTKRRRLAVQLVKAEIRLVPKSQVEGEPGVQANVVGGEKAPQGLAQVVLAGRILAHAGHAP